MSQELKLGAAAARKLVALAHRSGMTVNRTLSLLVSLEHARSVARARADLGSTDSDLRELAVQTLRVLDARRGKLATARGEG